MLKYLANLLADNHHLVTFISIYKELNQEDLRPSINFISLGIETKGVFNWRRHAISLLRKTIKSIPHDIVCSFMSDVSFLTRIATLGLDLKFVAAERNDPTTRPFIWKFLTNITYMSSDVCVFQLENARKYFSKFIQRKSVVIPNPVTSWPVEPFKGERKKTIVSAGRFVEEKRFENLIIAFAHIHSIIPDYTLTIYGDGPLRQKYNQIAKEHKIVDFVSFPGYNYNLSEQIYEDGLFVLTSSSEGIPNVLIEALSLGIPTVSTDCTPGGASFLTDGGNNGILIPIDDIDSLEHAIINVLTNKDLSEKLSKRGPQIVSRLTPEKINGLWIDLINNLN